MTQSGQTYPTLHAVRILAPVCGENLWILVGSEGTQMELTLRKAYDKYGWKYGEDRVVLNQAGYRPAEPTSVAIVAAYHTLSILLLQLLESAVEWQRVRPMLTRVNSCEIPPGSITVMTAHGVREIRSLLVSTLPQDLVEITGYDETGMAVKSAVNQSILDNGKRLGSHVKEQWTVLVAAAAYIIITCVLGVPIMFLIGAALAKIAGIDLEHFSILYGVGDYSKNGAIALAFILLMNLLDGLIYVYIVKLLTWGLRLIQGRPLGARIGKRTMLIIDYPCIHLISRDR